MVGFREALLYAYYYVKYFFVKKEEPVASIGSDATPYAYKNTYDYRGIAVGSEDIPEILISPENFMTTKRPRRKVLKKKTQKRFLKKTGGKKATKKKTSKKKTSKKSRS